MTICPRSDSGQLRRSAMTKQTRRTLAVAAFFITRSSTSASSSASFAEPVRRGRGISTLKSRPIFFSSINSTRSAMATASLTSCVTSRTVKPCSCHRETISSCISRRVRASSAPSGSSSSSRRGRWISARASATRCFCPPDSAAGHSCARLSSPTLANACRAASRQAPFSPSPTLSITVFHGSRRASS